MLELQVQPSLSRRRAILRDEWTQTEVAEGDIVHLIGRFETEDPSTGEASTTIVIDTEHQDTPQVPTMVLTSSASQAPNLLVLHPDVLVPATKVADVAMCMRKPLIQDRLRGTSDTTPALVRGSMLHEVLQACLTGQSSQVSEATEAAQSSDCAFESATEDVKPLAPKIESENIASPPSPWPLSWNGLGNFSHAFVEAQIDAQACANLESLFAIGIDTVQAKHELREAAIPFATFAQTYLVRDGRANNANIGIPVRVSSITLPC